LALLPPLLLQHGEKDEIVPVSLSQALHDSMTSHGRQAELVIYKDRHHDLSESMKVVVISKELSFFKDHRSSSKTQ